jgi:hypothetical protein
LDDKTDKQIVCIDKLATKPSEINLLTAMPHILDSELKYHEQGANFEYTKLSFWKAMVSVLEAVVAQSAWWLSYGLNDKGTWI